MSEWPQVVITISEGAMNPLPAWAEEASNFLPDFISIIAPDMKAPLMPAKFWGALWRDITKREDIVRVHCQCMAGHGRTGTFLSIMYGLAVYSTTGKMPTLSEIITFIRKSYVEKAVETRVQFDYIVKVLEAVDDTATTGVKPSNEMYPIIANSLSKFDASVTAEQFAEKFCAITGIKPDDPKKDDYLKFAWANWLQYKDGKFQLTEKGTPFEFPKASGSTGKSGIEKVSLTQFATDMQLSYPETEWSIALIQETYEAYAKSASNLFDGPGGVKFIWSPSSTNYLPIADIPFTHFVAMLDDLFPEDFGVRASSIENMDERYDIAYNTFTGANDWTFEDDKFSFEVLSESHKLYLPKAGRFKPTDTAGRIGYILELSLPEFITKLKTERPDVFKWMESKEPAWKYFAFNNYHVNEDGWFWDGAEWRSFKMKGKQQQQQKLL